MLGILALAILIIWALGIGLQVFGVAHVYNNADHEMHDPLHRVLDISGPASVWSLVTVLIVFWPALLVYKLVTK